MGATHWAAKVRKEKAALRRVKRAFASDDERLEALYGMHDHKKTCDAARQACEAHLSELRIVERKWK